VRSRTAGVMTALMRNGRDRRLGEPVMGHAILERVLLFGTRSADYIRASGHNGCIATEVTLQATTEAEYMTAPERFADSQIPLAPRAPSIHDPSLPLGRADFLQCTRERHRSDIDPRIRKRPATVLGRMSLWAMYGRCPRCKSKSDFLRSVRVQPCIRPIFAWRITSVAMQPQWLLALM
jgi:hypothetical protein